MFKWNLLKKIDMWDIFRKKRHLFNFAEFFFLQYLSYKRFFGQWSSLKWLSFYWEIFDPSKKKKLGHSKKFFVVIICGIRDWKSKKIIQRKCKGIFDLNKTYYLLLCRGRHEMSKNKMVKGPQGGCRSVRGWAQRPRRVKDGKEVG